MSKRFLCGFLVLLAAQLGLLTQASAQGTMSFGEEEVQEQESPEKTGPYAEILAEGKKLYTDKKYGQASLQLYKVVSAQDVAAEAYVPEAEYELGKTLFRMGLYQGALSYFGKIVDAGVGHPYYIPTLRGLVLLTDVIPGDPSLMQRLAPYASHFPQEVPEKYRDQFAYLVGRHLYQNMNTQEALRLLTSVSKRSEHYGEAHYIAAITHVANYQAQPAVKEFKTVLSHLKSKEEDGGLTPEERELKELTTFGMARVFYSTGDYATSLKYYSNIDRQSSRWPQALFESSWAYFQTDDYNKALGNLHSLNSPFFADAYFPEGPILSAVIFFYNCKYERVRHVLEDFDYYYAPLQDDVQAVLTDYQGPTEMYEWLGKLDKGNVQFDPQVYQLVQDALDDAEVERKFKLVDTVAKEIETIEKLSDSWQGSDLGGTVLQSTGMALSFAKNDAGTLARQRLQRVVRELGELNMQKEEIKFEVARAEQGQVKADIRAGMNVKGDVTKAPEINISDEQMYWTFDGEYWKDELGAYVFNINSQCSR